MAIVQWIASTKSQVKTPYVRTTSYNHHIKIKNNRQLRLKYFLKNELKSSITNKSLKDSQNKSQINKKISIITPKNITINPPS